MQGAFVCSTNLQFWHGLGTTGETLKVALIDSQGRFADWVSESWMTLAEMLANDTTDLVAAGFATAMTEQQDDDMNSTGVYVKSMSGISFITEGNYTAIVLDGVPIASDRCLQAMRWNGTYWMPAEYSNRISATYPESGRTWRFDADDQLTAPNYINEIVGFNGILSMNFNGTIPGQVVIDTAELVSVTPSSGTDDGLTLGTLSISANRQEVHLPTTINSAVTNTIAIRITTTDNQRVTRRGVLIAEAA